MRTFYRTEAEAHNQTSAHRRTHILSHTRALTLSAGSHISGEKELEPGPSSEEEEEAN